MNHYKQCASCRDYYLGSEGNMIRGVGYRCARYGRCFSMDDSCSHYTCNNNITDTLIEKAKKTLNEKKSWWHITTAVCSILSNAGGDTSISNTLMTLTNFRFEYVENCPDHALWLLQYDVVGPAIARAIYKDENKLVVADTLYHDYITPCANMVKDGQYEAAFELYTEMTSKLAEKYNAEFIYNKKSKEQELKRTRKPQ